MSEQDKRLEQENAALRLRFDAAMAEALEAHEPAITAHAESDRLRLRLASMEAALRTLVVDHWQHIVTAAGRCGCRVCTANEVLSGSDSALREMMMEAYYEGATDWQECGAPESVMRNHAEQYVSRILGTHKGGGE